MENEEKYSNIKYLEPVITERRVWNNRHVIIAFVLGILAIMIQIFAIPLFDLDYFESTFLAISILFIYGIILFFLLEPRILREVKLVALRTIEKPVVKEVYVDKPVIQEVVKEVIRPVVKEVYVDRPVYRDVIKEVEKPVYVHTPRTIPQGKRYKYVGSTETKIYHLSTSRLARLIRPKNRLYSNSESYFRAKGYKPAENLKRKRK